MMANDVNYSSRRIQRCVKSERDAGITRYDSLLACQILVPLVFADTSTSLQVCCRRWHRTTTATHYRASNSFPLKKKKSNKSSFTTTEHCKVFTFLKRNQFSSTTSYSISSMKHYLRIHRVDFLKTFFSNTAIGLWGKKTLRLNRKTDRVYFSKNK